MKLEWHEKSAGPMDWQKATDYCEALGVGWRLPTIKELISIVNYEKYGPATDKDMQPSYYWSSTTSANYPGSAWYVWYVSFGSGDVGSYGKSGNLYVRAVRTVEEEK